MAWSKLSYALGFTVIAASLAVLVAQGQKIAWGLLPIGLALVLWPHALNWYYGEDRPTRKQIRDMSADEYRQKLRNTKFEKWVKHLF